MTHLPLTFSLMPSDGPFGRWLAIVGIGEDGGDGLSPAATRLIAQARLLVGGARHLALAGKTEAERLVWPSPLDAALPAILARRGELVCVLASGDPFFFGVGSLLARHVPPQETICLPQASAFALAAARLGWAEQDCALISLHGRPLELIIPRLQPGARILALAWDGTTPARLARLLVERGLGGSRLAVFEAMGGPRQTVVDGTARALGERRFADLNTLAVEIVAGPGARCLPLTAGLPDAWFDHDGQLTKQDIRAVTLAALAPSQGEILWDVGAGSGSVGIEWMLRHPANRAIAVEARADRAARIARNALAFGVPDLRVIEGGAPGALAGLPAPDAVFVGGGAGDPALLDAVWRALRPGGRLVVNAVTVETQAELSRRFLHAGGELIQIAMARADPVGALHGWRPAMPVTQWRLRKMETEP